MNQKIYELAEQYAQSIIIEKDFQRLLFLKKEIANQLTSLVVAFKTAESNYLDSKRYEQFLKDNSLQEAFVQAKAALYGHPLVKEYKALERSIQAKLDEDLNALKSTVSNKFKLSNNFFNLSRKNA